MVSQKKVFFKSLDEFPLSGTLFTPSSSSIKKALIITPAIGVVQKFYFLFAEYLASQGILVFTFDYRCAGESKKPKDTKLSTKLYDWGEKDISAALSWMKTQFPDYSFIICAHSIGAQMSGLSPQIKDISAMVTVAGQVGYWGHWKGIQKFLLFLGWFVGIPVFGNLFKNFPAHWFGMGKPMPSEIFLQWARWGRDPEYLFGKEARPSVKHFKDFKGKLKAYSFSDDLMYGPFSAVLALHQKYEEAEVSHSHLKPKDLNLSSIGHFGFFKKNCQPLWDDVVSWVKNL